MSLFTGKNAAVYFDVFCGIFIFLIPSEVLNQIRDKPITHNTSRIQDNDSVMFGFYCIAFVEYMLAEKTLLYFTKLFLSNNYKTTK